MRWHILLRPRIRVTLWRVQSLEHAFFGFASNWAMGQQQALNYSFLHESPGATLATYRLDTAIPRRQLLDLRGPDRWEVFRAKTGLDQPPRVGLVYAYLQARAETIASRGFLWAVFPASGTKTDAPYVPGREEWMYLGPEPLDPTRV